MGPVHTPEGHAHPTAREDAQMPDGTRRASRPNGNGDQCELREDAHLLHRCELVLRVTLK